ncbi:MAG: long-chain fatty acid--CoA ligase [Alphaproteobacteria bacterium]
MLKGLMMDTPLNVSQALDYGAEMHADATVVSAAIEGGIHRITYGEIAPRVAQLAHALTAMGMKPGDRIATLAWNGYRHFELYYGIGGIGAVCHTINPRLFPEQLVYIVNHAKDRALFFDINLAPLVAKMRAHWPKDMVLVALCDKAHLPTGEGLDGVLAYEDLLASQPTSFAWPALDERSACALCYTSGTTGEPKGALYSHRSTLLHALFTVTSGMAGLQSGRTVLPVVPLFHVNAWGLPYTAPILGLNLVMPGVRLDGPNLYDLLDQEKVFSSWGVPTVWMGLLAEIQKRGRKPTGLGEIIIGGSAAPRAMVEAFETMDVDVVHGWGMTEMSPVGTLGILAPKDRGKSLQERIDLKARQGRRMFGVELKIVDEAGKRLPHDGEASGELLVRGPGIISGYYDNAAASEKAFDKEGWFGTGDVAKITPDGYLIIVDRTKDLVKSGGEWISSIDVENAAMGHPGVAQCAVIGVPHPKWQERPLMVVVKAPGADPSKDAIQKTLEGALAKWQLPDDIVFVDQLPMTATGKVSKLTLRKQFADFALPDVG